MLMTNQQTAELTKPGFGSLHDATALLAPHYAPVFLALSLVVLPVGRNQHNGVFLQPPAQRIRVVSGVGDYAFRFLLRLAYAWPARCFVPEKS
jgi:hypothetical protein